MAAFFRMSSVRVLASIAAAPSRNSTTSSPCSAIGTSPTALITEVRPPTQSHIGNRSSHPSATATLSRSLPSPVTATKFFANGMPDFLKAACAASMPLRDSLVPPDLEMTTTSVRPRLPPIWARTFSMPSGSVLSKKCGRIGFSGVQSASATSCGPSADPPMPTTRRSVNFSPVAERIFPAWTAAAKFKIDFSVERIASFSSLVGASEALRSQ